MYTAFILQYIFWLIGLLQILRILHHYCWRSFAVFSFTLNICCLIKNICFAFFYYQLTTE